MTPADIVLPGMVARVSGSERFKAELADLFEIGSAERADIDYEVIERPGGLAVRHDEHVLFDGDDRDLALIALYADLYERFIASVSLFLLHAGAAVKRGRAIVLPGAQESGKSTLTTLLAARGWSVISDDIAAIDVARMRVAPYPRHMLIRPQTLARNPGAGRGVRLVRMLDAYGELVHVAQPLRRARSHADVVLIAFPGWAQDGATSVVPLSRGQAAASLMDNSVNLRLLGAAGVLLAAQVSRRVPAYRLSTVDPEAAIDRLEQLHAA